MDVKLEAKPADSSNGHNGHNGHNGNGHNGNGHNGNGKNSTIKTRELSELELEARIGKRIEPGCFARMANGSWCWLKDGHDGPHEGAEPKYGPVDSLWHRHKGLKR